MSTDGAGTQPLSKWLPPDLDPDYQKSDGVQGSSGRRASKPTDGAESDASSDVTGRTRKKAEPVKSACVQCQKRKTKCSGQRPVCRFCSDRNLECSWDIGDGLTRTADLKRKLQEATGRSEDLDTLVDAMRHGTDDVSTMLLARLRLGESIEDLVSALRSRPSPHAEHDTIGILTASTQLGDLGRGNDHKPSSADVQSSTSPPDELHWSTPESSQPMTQSDCNWNADCNIYQLNNSQQYTTTDFDQTRMYLRRNNSL